MEATQETKFKLYEQNPDGSMKFLSDLKPYSFESFFKRRSASRGFKLNKSEKAKQNNWHSKRSADSGSNWSETERRRTDLKGFTTIKLNRGDGN